MVFLGRHCLGQLVTLSQYVATFAYACGELELGPFLTGTFTLQNIDVEVGKLGIVEVEVGSSVGIIVEQVGTCPVEHRHEVVADTMDTLCREVAQRLLINLYLVVAVRTAILDGLYHRQTLDHAPAHTIRLDVLTQVANLFTSPHFAQGHVVQSGDDALNTNLSQHGKRNLVLLAKPSPCSFHFVIV